ncbi:MAG: Mis12 protein-domain-containing protein [Benniella sp.]|nr:MAG: Mis12 protein-domain-containing protein [Benniella sp.]
MHQQQLLTEHFGFSPLSFVDDVINSVNDLIYQASQALQKFVESQMDKLNTQGYLQLDDNVHIIDECAKCMHKFETLLESAVDRNFDRFELYALKNLFGVPEKVDIVLPHYEELDFDISVEKDQKLDDELELLRSQLIATKALNYKLRKELEIEERRKRQLEKCREQIHFLKEAVNQYSDVAPVPQTLIFVRENIETLHRRFETFHTKLQHGIKANASTPTLVATVSTSTSNPTSSTTSYSPPENIAQALRETLLCMQPDQRALYLRSVVRRQVA